MNVHIVKIDAYVIEGLKILAEREHVSLDTYIQKILLNTCNAHKAA